MTEEFTLDSGTPTKIAAPGGQVAVALVRGSVVISGPDLADDVVLTGTPWLSPEHRTAPLYARLERGHDATITVGRRGGW